MSIFLNAVTLRSETIKAKARALGFEACGVADARAAWQASAWLEEYLQTGRHGDMDWLGPPAPSPALAQIAGEGAGGPNRRGHPLNLWPDAKTAIMLGQSYAPEDDSLALLEQKSRGLVSAYAARRDYHDVIKGKLKELASFIARETGQDVKVFVDTAPLMEKPLAQRAGLGWQGKHTNLVSREHGSWLFLGAILSASELQVDAPEADHCGSCNACQEICPTQAFPAPYQLDARRCLAYLSIEHKGQIPREFRKAMGNRIYGCDDCLAICPWNKFASDAREARLAVKSELRAAPLEQLATLDDAAFRALFAATPVKRTGRDRVVRNVVCAIGNSGDESLIPAALKRLDDAAPLVRGMAVWALQQYVERGQLDPDRFASLKRQRADREADAGVREEWAYEPG